MSNLKPIADVAGRATEATANDLLLSAGALVKQSVDSGQTLTIPNGYCLSVVGPYTINGDIVVSGDLMVI